MASPSSSFRHVFLTGPPGVGKTTLVRKACAELAASSVCLQGFYTEEVREAGKRIGFDIVSLVGQRGTLSKVGGQKGPKVGQYTVSLQSFESVALPVLSSKASSMVYVIDEVGKMELFSQGFIRSVRKLLDQSCATVFGTIPIPKGRPLGLVEEIRSRPDVQIITVSKDNRDHILRDIVASVNHARQKGGTDR